MLPNILTVERCSAMMQFCVRYYKTGATEGAYRNLPVIDAGYCLDAPTLIPAGSMYWDWIEEMCAGGLPSMSTISREGE